jgi:transketolase
MVAVAMESARLLESSGVSAQVVSVHTVKPLDEQLLMQVFDRFGLVATVEEHSVLGGLGGSVAEWMADRPGVDARLLRLGTDDRFLYVASSQHHARELYRLTAEAIAERIALIHRDADKTCGPLPAS